MVVMVFAVMLLVSENKYFIDTDLEPDNSILMLLSGVIVILSAVIISASTKKLALGITIAVEYVVLSFLFGTTAMLVGVLFSTILAVYIMANDDIKSWIAKIWEPENEKA